MIALSAISGIANATQRFERASQQLVEAVSGVSNEDPAQAIVSQIEAKTAFTANVKVLRAADEMTRSLLDILA